MAKSSKKTLAALLTVLVMAMSMSMFPVNAAEKAAGAKDTKTTVTKTAKETKKVKKTKKAKKLKKSKVKVTKVTTNKNKVLVQFKGKVAYENLAVVVTDADGKELEAKIVKKTKSQIKLSVKGLEKGKTYTVTVNGIKQKSEKAFGYVKTTFKKKK